MTRSSLPADAVADRDRVAQGRAHAKAIVLGEHAVLYGAPAVVIPVHGIGVTATIEPRPDAADGDDVVLDTAFYRGPIAAAPSALAPVVAAWQRACDAVGAMPQQVVVSIDGEIPISRGLGSSAAVAAALSDAVAAYAGTAFSDAQRFAIVQAAETVAHGVASGIDARAVMADAAFRFSDGSADDLVPAHTLHFVIADTGVPASTATAVASVRTRRDEHPAATNALLDTLATLADGAARHLVAADVTALGDAMNSAHDALRALGVSTDALDALVAAARASGAAGAKLTGGGNGGCVLVLAHDADTFAIREALLAAGAARTWTTVVPGPVGHDAPAIPDERATPTDQNAVIA